jgi:hypothetical protein
MPQTSYGVYGTAIGKDFLSFIYVYFQKEKMPHGLDADDIL